MRIKEAVCEVFFQACVQSNESWGYKIENSSLKIADRKCLSLQMVEVFVVQDHRAEYLIDFVSPYVLPHNGPAFLNMSIQHILYERAYDPPIHFILSGTRH